MWTKNNHLPHWDYNQNHRCGKRNCNDSLWRVDAAKDKKQRFQVLNHRKLPMMFRLNCSRDDIQKFENQNWCRWFDNLKPRRMMLRMIRDKKKMLTISSFRHKIREHSTICVNGIEEIQICVKKTINLRIRTSLSFWAIRNCTIVQKITRMKRHHDRCVINYGKQRKKQGKNFQKKFFF